MARIYRPEEGGVKRIAYHYHRPGKGTTIFEERLLVDRDDLKITLLERYDGRRVLAGDTVILEPGAPIVWFVFPGAWHDVGRFHLADGTFTGWYTNLCTPVVLDGARWSCDDLFLDLWTPAAGGPSVWLDEDEFATALATGALDSARGQRVREEQEWLKRQVAVGAWPPPATREFALADARERLYPGAEF
jgi:predicted RNA-binding protein associated with RNAse of E/G family